MDRGKNVVFVDVCYLKYDERHRDYSPRHIAKIFQTNLYTIRQEMENARRNKGEILPENYNHIKWYNTTLQKILANTRNPKRTTLHIYTWIIESAVKEAFTFTKMFIPKISIILDKTSETWFGIMNLEPFQYLLECRPRIQMGPLFCERDPLMDPYYQRALPDSSILEAACDPGYRCKIFKCQNCGECNGILLPLEQYQRTVKCLRLQQINNAVDPDDLHSMGSRPLFKCIQPANRLAFKSKIDKLKFLNNINIIREL